MTAAGGDGRDATGRTRDEQARRLLAGVAMGNIPTLLLVLVHLTGDRSWLDDPWTPSRTRGLGDNDDGGLDAEHQQAVRAAAADALLAWLDGRPPALPRPDDALLVRMMGVSLGERVPLEYAPMLAHELGLGPGAQDAGQLLDDVDEPPADPSAPRPPAGFRALVVGAGVSGICASIELAAAGIDHVVVERNDDIGGTWFENRYPGCAVDTPSHLYSYSFAHADWSQYFAGRDEIHAYLREVVDRFGVRERIRYRHEVVGATWDESALGWVVDVRLPDGSTARWRCDVLVTAVGAFNKPRVPDVPGIGSFAGATAHTARWPEQGVALEGRRVAVVGAGASAMQLVPAIADRVAHLTVVQRSPQWAAPFEKFQQRVPDPVRDLLAMVPLYRTWYRLRLSWAFNDKSWPALQRDPAWEHPERSVNAINDAQRRVLTRYVEAELGDDAPALLADLLPDYPPFGKRMLLDNGWYRTVRRDDVTLVTGAVTEVRPQGIVTDDGALHEVDVLVWATGFDVVHFLAPMRIVGRDGRVLEDEWAAEGARAYLGATVPGFPNLFCLYGPNTQFGHGGSLITVMERQIHYVMDLLRRMVAGGIGAVEVRADVHDDYNARVDAAHERMVWTHRGMATYYRNDAGRVVVNNPFRIIDYWRWTDTADLDDYRTTAARVGAP